MSSRTTFPNRLDIFVCGISLLAEPAASFSIGGHKQRKRIEFFGTRIFGPPNSALCQPKRCRESTTKNSHDVLTRCHFLDRPGAAECRRRADGRRGAISEADSERVAVSRRQDGP